MMQSRLGLRVIGLCLALAGLMAVGAGSAQAETGAYWLVNGTELSSETLLPTLASSVENNLITLLGSIGLADWHLSCGGGSLSGSFLKRLGRWLKRFIFIGCKFTYLKEGKSEPLPVCTPPKGEVETTQLNGLIALSGGSPVVINEPTSGTLISTINTGEECALGEKITISGKLGLKDAAFSTNQVTHLFTEHAATTELYVNGNKANKATLDGSVEVKLAGSHAGLTWSGKPA